MADRGRRNADSALITALAAGSTVRDAAASVGVGETTVYRRLQEPEFRHQIEATRREMVGRAVGTLADAASVAATTLRSLAESAESETVKLSAARSILELVVKLREHDELAERVAALERGQDDNKATKGTRWAS
jgi:transposase